MANKTTAAKLAPSKSKGSFGFARQFEVLIEYFRSACEKDEPWYHAFDLFPLSIEIFAPDGTLIFYNQAGMELNGIKDANLIVGKYNVLKDKISMDELGFREMTEKAFSGEIVFVKNFPAPIQDLVDRKIIKEKLADKSLSIKEAFAACGEDSRGWTLRVFKDITGLTPTQFRKEL